MKKIPSTKKFDLALALNYDDYSLVMDLFFQYLHQRVKVPVHSVGILSNHSLISIIIYNRLSLKIIIASNCIGPTYAKTYSASN